MVEGGTGTYSIQAKATLSNGAWTELYTTVRLGGAGVSGLGLQRSALAGRRRSMSNLAASQDVPCARVKPASA
jgi:hypothetical protein